MIKESTLIRQVSCKSEWDETLNSFPNYDSYHTYDYHHLRKNKENQIHLYHYKGEKCEIALPLIIRPIKGTTYFDATSTYGYVGPILKGEINSKDVKKFQNDLKTLLNFKKIICVFSRLHPFIKQQEKILDGLGSIENKGEVVYLNLKETEQNQLRNYNKRTKTQVNKARRDCLINEVYRIEEIKQFKSIYETNLKRLNASGFYYFNLDYYYNLMAQKSFGVKIYQVTDNEGDVLLGGGVLLTKGDYAQYHLSANNLDYPKSSQTKLLLDQMRIDAIKMGCSIFNLGGGLSINKDSLFSFKSLFSKERKKFCTWNFIVNKNVYNDLSSRLNNNLNKDYFPSYRS